MITVVKEKRTTVECPGFSVGVIVRGMTISVEEPEKIAR
jgi:hypothetical protein